MQQSRARTDHVDLSDRILNALSQETGLSPLEFDIPLYEVVDPDALNALFAGDFRQGTVEFTYLGYRISASSDGNITVAPRQ